MFTEPVIPYEKISHLVEGEIQEQLQQRNQTWCSVQPLLRQQAGEVDPLCGKIPKSYYRVKVRKNPLQKGQCLFRAFDWKGRRLYVNIPWQEVEKGVLETIAEEPWALS